MRIAHISDFHIAPLPAVGLRQLMSKRALGWFNWYRKRKSIHCIDILNAMIDDLATQKPDLIIHTGDITNLALDEEFSAAQPLLDHLAAIAPTLITGGNHDAYVPASATKLQQFISQFHHKQGLPTQCPALWENEKIAVLLLSSAAPTHLLSSGGKLAEGTMPWLQKTLEQKSREQKIRIVALHHPPLAKEHKFGQLRDAKSMVEVLEKYGAELVLHGHWHKNSRNFLTGQTGETIPILGVASASACPIHGEEPASYALLEPAKTGTTLILRGFARDGNQVIELRSERIG